MIGYDLDGTLCESAPKRDKPFFKQNGDERRAYEEIRKNHYMTACLIRTPDRHRPFIIITGRKEEYRTETEEWLAKNNLKPTALLMLQSSRTRENMIAHKLAGCREYQVTQYFEDDPKIAKTMANSGAVSVILVANCV